ncbi:MAG: hypothetical protein AB1898_30470 [Acidobacteriota bacterium]
MKNLETTLLPAETLVPSMPKMRKFRSPEVVQVLDRVRFELADQNEYSEFCWFAREYPRCYRFHMDGADFRLGSVHRALTELSNHLAALAINDDRTFEFSCGNATAHQVYWDFESFLSEVNVALDLLARVVGPAFAQESPPSFNKLCKKTGDHPLLVEFRRAQTRWVQRMKDYRDCFIHYTPVDTMLMVTLTKYPTGWEFRAKLPNNPNVREILGFRYSRKVELLRYAITVHRNMAAFDKRVAAIIERKYSAGEFPVRRDHLFFVGARS